MAIGVLQEKFSPSENFDLYLLSFLGRFARLVLLCLFSERIIFAIRDGSCRLCL